MSQNSNTNSRACPLQVLLLLAGSEPQPGQPGSSRTICVSGATSKILGRTCLLLRKLCSAFVQRGLRVPQGARDLLQPLRNSHVLLDGCGESTSMICSPISDGSQA